MTDAISPQQIAQKKIFKPSKKTKAPLRSMASTQSTQQTGLPQKTVPTPPTHGAEGPSDNLPVDESFRAQKSAKESSEVLDEGIASPPPEAPGNLPSGVTVAGDNPAASPKPPIKVDKSLKEQENHDMDNSSISSPRSSSASTEDTNLSAHKPSVSGGEVVKSPDGETEQQLDEGPRNRAPHILEKTLETEDSKQDISRAVDSAQDQAESQGESQHGATPDLPEPADVSKAAEGALRDTNGSTSKIEPVNKMSEPNTPSMAQAAPPATSRAMNNEPQASESPRLGDKVEDTHEFDNMGQPAHVERSIEIPLQGGSPGVGETRNRSFSNDLGDFEQLPSTNELPSLDNLPDLPGHNTQDPPEEMLDPSVHAPSPPGMTPIPKIPKIGHIGPAPSTDPRNLAQGLTGHVIDDVGSIVDQSGRVLGHATGDLPAMVGKRVADNGKIYGDDGALIGYVSENFIDQQPPAEDHGNVLSGLKVDREGNILDSDGHNVGKLHDKPGQKSSSSVHAAAEEEEGQTEGQTPKVNAHTGGSPSDIFLDVKSTTDGIQLTIRIPTTFARSVADS